MFEAIEQFHFIRPYWLLLVGIIPIILYLHRRFVGMDNRWQNVIVAELFQVLMPNSKASTRKWQRWFAGIVIVLTALALSGPTWARHPQPVVQKTSPLVVVLDLSLSMLAQDVKPSRIERAKQKVTDTFRLRSEGFSSIVAYAGDAHVVAPLTDDSATLLNLLGSLKPSIMPVLGSNPADGIRMANELMLNVGFTRGTILLVTDGVDQLAAVSKMLDSRFTLSILGVGSHSGAPIPLDSFDQVGQLLTDGAGNLIVTTLEDQRLKGLAELTGGRYSAVTLDDSDINYLLAEDSSEETIEIDERQFDTWQDMGFVLLLPLAVIFALALRRGVLIAAFLVVSIPHEASWFDDLWLSKDRQAHEALVEGRPDIAEELFEDSGWRAVAKYRQGDFEGAAQLFGDESSIASTFNLGNALAKNGNLLEAIATYDEVLRHQPDHEDAKRNKELVERILEEQQASEGEGDESQRTKESNANQMEEDSKNSEEVEQSAENAENSSEQNADAHQGESQTKENPGNEEQPAQELMTAEEQATRETQDTYERWLRGIPDDPGSLLQRKFQKDTQARRQQDGFIRRQPRKNW